MVKVLVLRDKKPGHAHQAEGLALAIGRLAPIEATGIDVKPRWFGHNRLLAALIGRVDGDPGGWLRRLYGIDAAALPAPDAIVSSGRPTIAAGILLARHFGAPFIYAGRITRFPLDDVALQLVAAPGHAAAPKAVYAPIPTRVDRSALPPGQPLRTAADLRGARVAVLVGGPAADYRFSDRDWTALERLLETSTADLGLRFVATTSRRSPDAIGDALAALATRGVLERFIDWRSAGPGSADGLLAADAVLVTEDSLSMLAEAVASGRPAVALSPEDIRPGFSADVVAGMRARGSLAVLKLAEADPSRLAAALLSVEPERENPRDRLARVVAPVLGLG